MRTYVKTAQFKRDYVGLSREQKALVRRALARFLQDLPSRRFRKGLRVKGVQGAHGIFEMTWSRDGRATFEYGEEIREGEPHIIWRRIGGHGSFGAP